MTDTTATPDTQATTPEGASEPPAATEQQDTATQDPKRTDAEQIEHWKKHAREWEERSKRNLADKDAAEARAAKLADDLESGADVTEALASSRAQAARYKAALDAGMDADTADAVLTATDPDQITAQAAAFKAAVEAAAGKLAERDPGTSKSEDPNAGSSGASKPDYRAQADRLAKMR